MQGDIADRISGAQVPEVVRVISALGPEEATENLIQLIELSGHRAYPVREAAARKLGEAKAKEAIPVLLKLTLEEEEGDRHVRRAAVNALVNYRGAEVEKALDAATYDSALNVRADAERALAVVRGRP